MTFRSRAIRIALPEARRQTEAVNLTARVVRCRLTEASSESAAARIRYDIGITFDLPSSAAQRILQQLCGTAMEPDDARSQPSQGGLR
jgi:hypothetical protein